MSFRAIALGSTVAVLLAALSSPLLFSGQERAGHALADHCVTMLAKKRGAIQDVRVTVTPYAAANGRDLDHQVHQHIKAHKKYPDSNFSFYSPMVFIEYREGSVGPLTDAYCTYSGSSAVVGDPPGYARLESMLIMTEALAGTQDKSALYFLERVDYRSPAAIFLAPYRWLKHRARIAQAPSA